MSTRTLTAQTCTGSLGDPIVHIDFGSGNGFGQPLAAGITNMTYIQTSCPEDGFYTITNSTLGCFNGSWWNINSDHTGNPNGYYMLINASYQPSDFYVQTVSGLCEGTTYQFAAWVMNIVRTPNEILPNITFTIEKTDGTILQSTNTGAIAEQVNAPAWNQYAFFFTTPPGVTTVVLRMTNNAPGGIGNDLAVDDITFRAAGPTVNINAPAVGVPGSTADTLEICADDTRTINFTSQVDNCYVSTAYQWQVSIDGGATWSDIPGAIGSSFGRAPTKPGVFLYRLKVAQTGNIGLTTCSIASLPLVVVENKIPDPAITIRRVPDTACVGEPMTFLAAPVDGGNLPLYRWEVNGNPIGGDSAKMTDPSPANGDQVLCFMTSNAYCMQTNPTVASNQLTAPVLARPYDSVSIAPSANPICADSAVSFRATPYNGGNTPSYQWFLNGQFVSSAGPAWSSASLRDSDKMQCIMTSSLTCSLPFMSDSVLMTIYPLPTVALPPDTVIAGGDGLRLMPEVTGDIGTYTWTPPDGLDNPDSESPYATPISSTTYSLTVVTRVGCRATASQKLGVFYNLSMPSAFTPNVDGINDVFRVPPSVPVVPISFSIYNRWGQRIFFTSNSNIGWDGSFAGHLQPAGVYIWEIRFVDPVLKRTFLKSGTVTLVR
jgi:gliding motility-associated-like protein